MPQRRSLYSCIDMQKLISDENKNQNSKDARVQTNSPTSVHSRPSPYEFDEFIPWMCFQFQCPGVTIKRIIQEEYVKAAFRRVSTKSTKSVKSKPAESQHFVIHSKESAGTPEYDDDAVRVKAYYVCGNLQEVAIVGCPFDIDRLAMKIICMALPYHETLHKLTIRNGGLTALTLHEIAKILPETYLTDICLDDTNVHQKNYAILFQNASRLINLSLNRCQLEDDACKEIASRIDIGTPGYNLRTLELSSNGISDEGALAFADLLRRNRQLLHLNLSGNRITDKGASAILNTLKEFPMSYEEVLKMKRNKLKYYCKKMALYNEYVQKMMIEKERDAHKKSKTFKSTGTGNTSSKAKSSTPKKNVKKTRESVTADNLLIDREALGNALEGIYSHPDLELQAREAIGEFQDPFDNDHIVLKDDNFYCVGNMFLCSLNLAYNILEYMSVRKILGVLEYQSETKRPFGSTGLLRVIFQGNCIPEDCNEYKNIEMLLQNAITDQLPKPTAIAKKKDKGGKRISKIL